jgi:FkbM family methyltransferase
MMISYAQNREDVLLHRVLAATSGFYIDVGAAHPVGHSVTKWFSDCGWTGINIEPLPEFFTAILNDRPHDVNLNCCCSDHEGEITLHAVPDCTGRATVDETALADLAATGHATHAFTVPCRTLNSICAEHARGRAIDFLKIDVENHEAAVLAGIDLTTWRPRVIVVEATLPGQTTLSHEGWEPGVLAAGYHFAAFDGLNRYYVRDEDAALLPKFAAPVNVLDDYTVHVDDEAFKQLAVSLAKAEMDKLAAINDKQAVMESAAVMKQGFERLLAEQNRAALAALDEARRESVRLQATVNTAQAALQAKDEELAQARRELHDAWSESALWQVRHQRVLESHVPATALAASQLILTRTREHLETLRASHLASL